jgi:hypothetical protein
MTLEHLTIEVPFYVEPENPPCRSGTPPKEGIYWTSRVPLRRRGSSLRLGGFARNNSTQSNLSHSLCFLPGPSAVAGSYGETCRPRLQEKSIFVLWVPVTP